MTYVLRLNHQSSLSHDSMTYVLRLNHQSSLSHESMTSRLLASDAVQKSSNTAPCPRAGIDGSMRFRSTHMMAIV